MHRSRNLNDPVWETEWEAFNSSVVAWVPGVGNTSQYPTGTGINSVPVSIKGFCNPGDTRHYQLWYRDSATFCTGAVFNLSNALTLVWN